MPLVSYSSSYDYGPCLCYRCRYTGLALVVLNTGLTLVIVAVAGLALALVAGAAAAVQIRALPLVSYGPCPCRPCHSHMEYFVLLSNVLPHHDRLDSPDHVNDRSTGLNRTGTNTRSRFGTKVVHVRLHILRNRQCLTLN